MNPDTPLEIEDAYPLTRLQAGMLFHSEYSSESAIYHDIFGYHLQAPFDLVSMQHAIQQLVERHPVLRTSFNLGDFSEPLQLVHQKIDVPLQVIDICSLSDDEQEKELTDWMETEKKHRFEWTQPPLLRFYIHLRSAQTFQVTLSFHHAILDGWSVASTMTELFKLYLLDLDEGTPLPPAPKSTFRDFVALESQALASEEFRRFWVDRLQDCPETKLPVFSDSIGAVQAQPANLEIALTMDLSQKIKHLATRLGVPVKSILLAAHLKVLGFLSGKSTVVTGLVTNGRLEEGDGERTLGLFLNTLPLFIELVAGSWTDLIKATFEAEQTILPMRRFPLAEIQKSLKKDVLFETAFDLTHFHVYRDISGLQNHRLLGFKYFEQTNFPFMGKFSLGFNSDQIFLILDYDSQKYMAEQIEAVGQYYIRTLSAMVEMPQDKHESFSPLSLAERERVLYGWNDTGVGYGGLGLIHEVIASQAENRPEAIALMFEGQSLRYGELDRRSNQLARKLKTLGVGPDVIVGIYMERMPELLVGLLGILKAGGAYLPLDPSYPAGRLGDILADAKAPVLLTVKKWLPVLPEQEGQVLCLDSDWAEIAQQDDSAVKTKLSSQNLAYVIYTSGSTGKPKGTMNTHGGIYNRLCWMQEMYGLTAEDSVLQKTPYSFDVSVWELFWPLMFGARQVLARPEGHKDSRYLAEMIVEEGVSTVHFVPSMLRVFLEEPKAEGCVMLKRVICSGEALAADIQEKFFEVLPGVELWNLYGPTEAAVDVTYWRCERGGRVVPIGRPIANTQMYVLDEKLEPVVAGVMGELYIGGVGVGRGYLNRAELTAEKFIPDPYGVGGGGRLYRTGDLGRYRTDGAIEFLGRIDHQVKVRGFRIELGEIETILRLHPHIADVIVTTARRAAEEEKLVAYFIPRQNVHPTSTDLRLFVQTRLPEYMIPTVFMSVETFPRTASGKIDRKALPVPDPTRPLLSQEYTAPRTATEENLANIWAEELGLKQVGIHDSLFELGGHSLLALRLVARINASFNIDIPLRDLFEAPTVAHMALLVAQHQATGVEDQLLDQILQELEQLPENDVQKALDSNLGRSE